MQAHETLRRVTGSDGIDIRNGNYGSYGNYGLLAMIPINHIIPILLPKRSPQWLFQAIADGRSKLAEQTRLLATPTSH